MVVVTQSRSCHNGPCVEVRIRRAIAIQMERRSKFWSGISANTTCLGTTVRRRGPLPAAQYKARNRHVGQELLGPLRPFAHYLLLSNAPSSRLGFDHHDSSGRILKRRRARSSRMLYNPTSTLCLVASMSSHTSIIASCLKAWYWPCTVEQRA